MRGGLGEKWSGCWRERGELNWPTRNIMFCSVRKRSDISGLLSVWHLSLPLHDKENIAVDTGIFFEESDLLVALVGDGEGVGVVGVGLAEGA